MNHPPLPAVTCGQHFDFEAFATQRAAEDLRDSAEVAALICGGKLPGFVDFHDGHSEAAVELYKHLAIYYLKLGYRGWLRFYRDSQGTTSRLDCIVMHFRPWQTLSTRSSPAADYPPLVAIDYFERPHSAPEILPGSPQALIALCLDLGLKEIESQGFSRLYPKMTLRELLDEFESRPTQSS